MKKYLLYIPVACALLGLASCSQDRDPKYHAPTKFHLNTPPMQDMEIVLTEGNTLEFTCDQPDYGFAASASYSMQMSLTEDFATSYDLDVVEEHNTKIQIQQSQVSSGFCELIGVTSEEDYNETYPDGFQMSKIYFRAVCKIAGIEDSEITSNVVTYNNLKPYFAVAVPGYIYLVGKPEGWAGPSESNAEHYAPWRLFEPADAIGSKVYRGVFEIPAGDDAMFRFYTALTGWDNDSYGVQVDDNAVQFPEFAGGTFEHQLVKGKGSFWFPNWPGGTMTIVVDMSDPNNMTVTCTAGEAEAFIPKYIYLVGSISGWMDPGTGNEANYQNYRLVNSSAQPDVYTASFAASAGKVNFRFALQLDEAGWDNPYQIGSQVEDADVDESFTNGVFTGPYVLGKGNWAFELEEDATISMSVDTANETVEFVLE